MPGGWKQDAKELALPAPGHYSKSTLPVNMKITQDLTLVLYVL